MKVQSIYHCYNHNYSISDLVGSKSVTEATLSKLFGVQDQSVNDDVILCMVQ